MASRTFLLLLVISFIATVFTEDQSASEAFVNDEDNDEIEETTFQIEDVEDEYKTTTVIPEEIKAVDDDIQNKEEDVKHREETEEIAEVDTPDVKDEHLSPDIDETLDNTTDSSIIVTYTSLNNDVEIHSNDSNNIDVAKTESVPVQTTTKVVEEEPVLTMQEEQKDQELPGPRSPKADNENIFPQNTLDEPQSTRSVVRGWMDDSWIRRPIGILVPMRASALSRALAVWADLNTSTLDLNKVCFIAYDEMGIVWRSRHNLHPSYNSHEVTVKETLSKLLLKYQDINTDSRRDGTMRALITAAKLVPYDSALLVITDQGGGDSVKLPLALRAVVEKRLKVYTVWTGPIYPGIENDGLKALRNISKHTEGDIIPYPLQIMGIDGNPSGEAELEQWNPLDPKLGRRGKYNSIFEQEKYDPLVVRRGGGQAISLGIPVESGVTALRIFIEGAVEHAVLYPPNDGPQIALYNMTSVSSFSPASKTETLSPREIYLVFPGSLPSDNLSVLPATPPRTDALDAFVGMWHLSVRCDTCDYRLLVAARGQIHFDVNVESTNVLQFRVTGPVASIRESQLVDEYGNELAKLPYSYQPLAEDGQTMELQPVVDLVVDVPIPEIKEPTIYAKIVGRDTRGEPFVRLTGPLITPEVRMGRSASLVAFPDSSNDLERVEEYNAKIYSSQQPFNNSNFSYNNRVSQVVNQQGTILTSIQIGLASRLYGSSGESLQLHFEVTNYREQAVRFSFGAVGELRFLIGISPRSETVVSGQTVNVIVSLSIPTTVQPGARDTITFTAYGNEQISMSAYVYVANGGLNDIWAPELRHTFQGSCIGRTGDDCTQHTWSANIIARDGISGLLRLSSSPIGLLYNGEFISGTRQEVVATYRATCCAPRVLINAVDANGNANSYVVDISGYLNEAAIAAIVLGVFLLIALIAIIIVLIYWCVKKRRESRELPSYNTRT